MKVRDYEKHDTGMDCKRHDFPWNENTFMFKQGCLWCLQKEESTPHPSAELAALSPA